MPSNPEEPNPDYGERESAVTPDPIRGAVEANAGWNRGLVEHSRDLLCIHDLEGRLLSVNPEPARQLGYAVEELLRLPMRERVPPGFRPQFDDYLKKIAREGQAHGLLTILTRSGERRVWEYHNTLRTEGESAPVVYGVAHDVTDRRRIERELRKSAEGFRLLEEYAPALAMFDREMRYLYASRRWRTDYGLGDRDLRGVLHYDVCPETPERWKQAHRRGLAGEVLREENDRFDRADGSTQWVRWEIRPWYETTGAVGGIVIFAEDVTDITERKRAAALLEESEKRFRAVHERAPVGIALVDARSGRFLQVNPTLCKIAGRTADEMLRLSYPDITHPHDREDSAARTKQLIDGTVRAYDAEKRYLRPDGTAVLVNLSVVPMWEPGEQAQYLMTIVQDITERKRAEQALRKSEAELREAQRLGRLGSWYRDLKTDTLTWSEQLHRILGLDPKAQSPTFNQMERFFAPESWKRLVQANERLLSTGGADELEVELRRQDGAAGWAIMYREAVRDEAGNFVGIRGVGLDITERKRAEQALRESEARLRLAQEVAKIGVFERNLQTDEIRWSTEMGALHGLAPAEYPKTLEDLLKHVHPEDRAYLQDQIEKSIQTGDADAGWRVVWPDGTVHWIAGRWHAFRDEQGRPLRLLGMDFDITDRKRAEEALQASEERYRSVVSAMAEGILLRDADGRILACNRSFEQMLGVTSEQMVGTTAADWEHRTIHEDGSPFPADDHPAMVALRTGKPQSNIRMGFRRQDGGLTWISINAQPIFRSGESKPHAVVTTFADITDRMQAEQALRESEERMRLAQEAAKIGTFERNMQTGEGYWTRQTEEMFGLEPGAGPKSIPEFLSLIHPADRKHVEDLFAESIATGRTAGEWRVIWPDGSVHWIDGRWSVFKDEQGRPLRAIGIDSDITERKQTEEALRASEADLREAQRVALMGSWRLDLTTLTVTVSNQLFRIAGREPRPGKIPFEELSQFFPPEAWQRLLQAHEKFLQSRQPEEMEIAVRRPDGTPAWLLARGEVETDDAGNLIGLRGIAIDTTERMRTEEALRQTEERLRVALKNTPITLFNQNRDLRYTWAHNLPDGWTEADFLGKTPEEIFDPAEAAQLRALTESVLKSGQGRREELSLSACGNSSYCDVTVEPLPDSSGHVVGVSTACMDISNLHQATQQLRQAKEKLTEEKLYLEHTIDTELGFEEIIGKSAGIKAVMELVARVATSDATVLLLGETGVGKELVARAIHRLSSRSGNAFIKMNCAAIPTGLLESELFGAEKGAYTGAVSRKIGRLELADKGTLFLDEIGEIALSLQPKLLRVLQDQEFERLGGTQTLKVNFRLIAATNRDLADDVQRNQFRSDLFYRLNVFPIVVPPLRERRDDIPLLVNYFVQKCSRRLNKSITSIPKRTMAALTSWDWPGNVRELENFIERSIILTNGSVLAAPLGELQARLSTQEQSGTLEAAERKHILEALRESKGRISGEDGAAARLGLKRTTLQSKLKQMRINPRTPPSN